MSRRKDVDALSVQIAFRVRVPVGTKVTKKALQSLFDHWVATGELPRNVELRGIFWRNPERHGNLRYWRYSQGSDLGKLKKHGVPVESHARGTHEDARGTLYALPYMDIEFTV